MPATIHARTTGSRLFLVQFSAVRIRARHCHVRAATAVPHGDDLLAILDRIVRRVMRRLADEVAVLVGLGRIYAGPVRARAHSGDVARTVGGILRRDRYTRV